MSSKPRQRRLIAMLLSLLGLVAIVYGATEIYSRRDYRSDFADAKGELIGSHEEFVEQRGVRRLITFDLQSDAGYRVQGYALLPESHAAPHPVMIILGGLRTGRRTIDYLEAVPADANLALVTLDYPYEGKKSNLAWHEFVVDLPRIRRGILDTVPAVMLCVDYLCGRDDIDTDRITLAGGSIGALFAPAGAATDERIDALALLFGAGDLRSLYRANIDLPPALAQPLSWLCAVLSSPLEPLKYIGDVSPRPLFILNGIDDDRLPERCIQLLQDRAREPKTVRWIEGGHVNIRSTEFHGLVIGELATWLRANDLVSAVDGGAPPTPASP